MRDDQTDTPTYHEITATRFRLDLFRQGMGAMQRVGNSNYVRVPILLPPTYLATVPPIHDPSEKAVAHSFDIERTEVWMTGAYGVSSAMAFTAYRVKVDIEARDHGVIWKEDFLYVPDTNTCLGFSKEDPRTRVLVCGGREYGEHPQDWPTLLTALNGVAYGLDMIGLGPVAFMQGDYPTGADRLARVWAQQMGIPCRGFPADWDTHGKAAGPIRNSQMLSEGKPHLVIPFAGGDGTADMVKKARKAGVPVLGLREDYIPYLRELVKVGKLAV